jgi:hypothetical protein
MVFFSINGNEMRNKAGEIFHIFFFNVPISDRVFFDLQEWGNCTVYCTAIWLIVAKYGKLLIRSNLS